jgi:hypothetical protein
MSDKVGPLTLPAGRATVPEAVGVQNFAGTRLYA